MRQLVLGLGLLLVAGQTFAHGDDNGMCKPYEEKCKADATVTAAKDKAHWEAMKTCISTAAKADGANGQKCLDAQAKHMHGPKPVASPSGK